MKFFDCCRPAVRSIWPCRSSPRRGPSSRRPASRTAGAKARPRQSAAVPKRERRFPGRVFAARMRTVPARLLRNKLGQSLQPDLRVGLIIPHPRALTPGPLSQRARGVFLYESTGEPRQAAFRIREFDPAKIITSGCRAVRFSNSCDSFFRRVPSSFCRLFHSGFSTSDLSRRGLSVFSATAASCQARYVWKSSRSAIASSKA